MQDQTPQPQQGQAPNNPQSQHPQGESPQSPHDDGDAGLNNSLEAEVAKLQAQQGSQRGKESEEKAETEEKSETRTRREVPRPNAAVLASIHRREQQIQQKQAELTKLQDELSQRESVFKKGKHTPFEALKLLGYDDPKSFMEQIAQTGGEWTPEQQKIHELEQWKANQEKEATERQRQAEQDRQAQEVRQAIDGWHKDIAKFVKEAPEYKESLVAIPGSEASVFQVIQDHYRETGERMDIEDACAVVHGQMEDQFAQALNTIAGNPRGRAMVQEFAAKLAPNEAKRGKSTARNTGISNAVRNETRSTPLEDVDLDTALAQAAFALREGSRR